MHILVSYTIIYFFLFIFVFILYNIWLFVESIFLYHAHYLMHFIKLNIF